MNTPAIAKRVLGLIDLTNLNDDCTKADIDLLCARAITRHGSVAAVCVWPAFVAQAVKLLEGTDVKVATVVNFPAGGTDRRSTLTETKKAVGDGADEIDLVIPYSALKEGDETSVRDMMHTIRAATHNMAKLKAIIESGMLADELLIKKASQIALEENADFIKTSTGKVAENATLHTAQIMLDVLKEFGDATRGFKPAGGIRTLDDAAAYLALADDIMGPQWATADTFRFGASGLLDAVLSAIEGGDGSASGTGY